MSMLTRRELRRIVGPILELAMATKKLRGTAASRLHIDSLLAGSDLALPTPAVRAYRADAVIALLGVPIFAREAVGSAFAVVREAIEGDQKIIALQFAGGSNPERSHGFRYDGSMEETVLERGSRRQAAYFGFVTSASNENYEQARQRVLSRSSSPRTFVAVERVHSFGWERAPDPHVGAALAASQLTFLPDAVIRVTGRTSCPSTQHVSTFRMWQDNRFHLPLRIEFQPRSYLRISLEHEPAGAQPNNRRKEET
jgi:hypothetical protein